MTPEEMDLDGNGTVGGVVCGGGVLGVAHGIPLVAYPFTLARRGREPQRLDPDSGRA